MSKSIGLQRGTVKVVPYQHQWAEEFAKEKERILATCGDQIVAIEHIGSTAVPGLAAKPIIDMAAGLRRFQDADTLIKPLAALGYQFYKHFQHQLLFCKGPEARRTHYLHVMRYRGAKWQSDQLFRNYLRTHPREVERYANLKAKLARQYPEDRDRYTQSKDHYIKSVVAKAKQSFAR